MKFYDTEQRQCLVEKANGLAYYRTWLQGIDAEAWIPYGHIGYSLTSIGKYERPVLETIQNLGEGDFFVDIGANIGLMSLAATSVGCEVVAFEPEDRAREILELNFAMNGIHDSISNLAISDSYGKAELYVSPLVANSSLASCKSKLPGQPVEKSPLDKVMRRVPDAIKIDVEGTELEVLQGARQVLEAMRPGSWVIVEVHGHAKVSHRAVVNHLEMHGFKVNRLVGSGELLPADNFKSNGQIIGIK